MGWGLVSITLVAHQPFETTKFIATPALAVRATGPVSTMVVLPPSATTKSTTIPPKARERGLASLILAATQPLSPITRYTITPRLSLVVEFQWRPVRC